MSIIIRASDTGFHMRTASGRVTAVPVFLQTPWQTDASFTAFDHTPIWYADDLAPLTVSLTTDYFLLPAHIGDHSYLTFTGARISQAFANGETPIATIHFTDPIQMRAQYDQHGPSAETGWQVDFATPYQSEVKDHGLKFIGGDGVDIFQPRYEPTYYRETTLIKLGGGDDTAVGTQGNDRIIAGDGDDTLSDDHGTNFLTGQSGDDHITLGNNSHASTARGGDGNDMLVSGHGDDTLYGNRGADQLFGNNGDDFLKGGSGSDTLFGGSGDDILLGGGQSDTLRGGRGDDHLTGDSGADIFVFYQNTDGHDTITDFGRGQDIIHLDDYIGQFADLILAQSGTDTIITIQDESFSIRLENTDVATLGADDFLFAT